MKRNESSFDRIIRVVLGAALIAGGVYVGGTLGIVLYVLAAVMLVTAAVGFCPLYALLHISTFKAPKG